MLNCGSLDGWGGKHDAGLCGTPVPGYHECVQTEYYRGAGKFGPCTQPPGPEGGRGTGHMELPGAMETFEGKCLPLDGWSGTAGDGWNFATNSTAECNSHCLATAGCVSFTVRHDTSMCYLNKRDVQRGHTAPPIWPLTPGPCTSAMVVGQPPDGAPALSLYNVRDDVSERHNLTDQQPAIVKRLQALVAEYWATRVPQCNTQTCGSPECTTPNAPKHDPVHGPYSEPWC